MKYEKPEVTLINGATAAIQHTTPSTKSGSPYDNVIQQTLTATAYEADE
jgi:hypothetical protein